MNCRRCGNTAPKYVASTEEGACCDRCHGTLPRPAVEVRESALTTRDAELGASYYMGHLEKSDSQIGMK